MRGNQLVTSPTGWDKGVDLQNHIVAAPLMSQAQPVGIRVSTGDVVEVIDGRDHKPNRLG